MFENKHAGAVAVISLSYDSYDDLSIGKAEVSGVLMVFTFGFFT